VLSSNDIGFLNRLRNEYQGGWALCQTNPPSQAIQRLVDRGYCRLSDARCGPLGTPTGEVMVRLSEAGLAALSNVGQAA